MRLTPCCGQTSYSGALCCTLDPRDDGSGGRVKNPEGCYCLWCGDDIPQGWGKPEWPSYCSRACGISYYEDVVASWDGTPDPEV